MLGHEELRVGSERQERTVNEDTLDRRHQEGSQSTSKRLRWTVKGYTVSRSSFTVTLQPFVTLLSFFHHPCIFPLFCGLCRACLLSPKCTAPWPSIPTICGPSRLFGSAPGSFFVHDGHSILIHCRLPPFAVVPPPFMVRCGALWCLMAAFQPSTVLCYPSHPSHIFAVRYCRAIYVPKTREGP